MQTSSSWSTASARPPRPLSAKTKRKVLSARPQMLFNNKTNNLGEESDEIVDDDGDGEFGVEAEQEYKQQQFMRQQRRQPSDERGQAKFRPVSAPARRPKSACSTRAHNDEVDHRAAQSISIAYLRAAAEKKKARDREFARELLYEETEFKKRIAVRIEQANKMMTSSGSRKSFELAPDRDGIHMIKVHDPLGGDRIISVEMFLREFEKLATVPLGHHQASVSKVANGTSSRLKPSQSQGSLSQRTQAKTDEIRTRSAKVKPLDHSQVQEELRTVLEGTIDLTKILQEQLHELQLKGWNVPRT